MNAGRARLALGLLLAAAGLIPSCGGEPRSERRLVVLGVDGLDPEMLQERIERGLCPNFARLIQGGATFQPLQTSWPPQSPVAWTNFITGSNPGKHGLYDFIHVDRHSYGVANSMSYTDEVGMEISLFGYKLPLSGGEQHLTRAFPAFWEVISEAGVPVAVWRMPANFPPQETRALTFPDMGTPDLSGAASGRAFLWTDSIERSKRDSSFYSIIPVNVTRNPATPDLVKVYDQILGPENTLRNVSGLERDLRAAEERGDAAAAAALRSRIATELSTSMPFTAYVDRTGSGPQVAVRIGEDSEEWAIAEEGGWTRWVQVEFDLAPMVAVSGWMRFLFKSADPFELYGTPVQIDPFAPAMDISTPPEAAAELAESIGPYYTQGFPDAYIAYKSGLLDTGEFVSQSDTVVEERQRMLGNALDRFGDSGGLLFFYVGSLDLRCHMLWHCQDDQHPHQEADGQDYAEQIDRIYAQVDAMLGELLRGLEPWPAAELIVMSDHGFAPFRRKMHVNDWLLQEGYLVLKPGVELRQDGFHADGRFLGGSQTVWKIGPDGQPQWDENVVDWERTKAYCIGFNGVILNRAGREPRGVVTEAEAELLLQEIAAKLRALRDVDGTPVFSRVLPAAEVFSGPRLGEAPDLQLGFNVGYGASDECATGEITGEGVIVDNDSRWSGSHLMDPELVRGTILVRSGVPLARDPRLEDITATLYHYFGVEPPAGMDGEPLF